MLRYIRCLREAYLAGLDDLIDDAESKIDPTDPSCIFKRDRDVLEAASKYVRFGSAVEIVMQAIMESIKGGSK